VPLILFLIFYTINTYIIQNKHNNMAKQINIYKKSIIMLKNKHHKINNIKIIKYIEQLATAFNITILNINIVNSSFNIQFQGKYKDVIQFLVNIENNMQITFLDICTTTESKTKIDGIFKIYSTKLSQKFININNIPNPFHKKRTFQYINNDTITLKLIAIFNKDVCINDKWYSSGDTIGKYKLEKIFKDYVILTYKKKTTILRILQDDK